MDTRHIFAGILFPESTLTSPLFFFVATAVAFNTIIYLTLTISKFIPWPKQRSVEELQKLETELKILSQQLKINTQPIPLPLNRKPFTPSDRSQQTSETSTTTLL